MKISSVIFSKKKCVAKIKDSLKHGLIESMRHRQNNDILLTIAETVLNIIIDALRRTVCVC